MIPEENFMMVRNKYNSQVKRILEGEIRELKGKGNRWDEC